MVLIIYFIGVIGFEFYECLNIQSLERIWHKKTKAARLTIHRFI